MKYYEMQAFVNFLAKTEGHDSPTWQKTISTLQNLITELKPYGEKDDLGNYKSITPQAYNKIETIFDEAVVSTNAFLKENVNNNNIEDDTRIKSSANFNKEFLSKAYTEFKNVKPDPKRSLYESMEHFRYQNVELSNDELNRLGGNMSSRIQMTIDLDGVKTKGVFTKNTVFDPKEQAKNLYSEMKLKYPAFNSFWNSMENANMSNEDFDAFTPNLFMNMSNSVVYDTNPQEKNRALRNTYELTNMPSYPGVAREFNKFKDDPDFYGALLDFSINTEKIAISRGVNEEFLGMKTGESIDNRNSAMSGVANLLGVNDLIAKSKNVTVKMPDGSFQNGTFMEFVNSKDITKLDSVDEMRVSGLDAYESKDVKVQLANLQTLDYICGNVDRHTGNILYRFDPKTHKLSSIKGIDNDASFPKEHLDRKDNLGQLPGIDQMRVIDQKMAEKILNTDDGMLENTLHGYGLSQEEIDASIDRLHNLQDAIKGANTFDPEKGLEPYDGLDDEHKLTIVKSEDWDKLKLEDLKSDSNYFKKIINVQKTITTNPMVTYEMRRNFESSKRSAKAMLKPENTQGLLERAQRHKPFMGTSQRYTNVLNAFRNYQNTPVPDDPLSEAANAKWESAEALKRAVDAYNQEKIDIGHFDAKGNPAREFSGKALGRIQDVAEIGKFVNKILETKKAAFDSKNTLETANRKQQELDEFKSKSPEEQKQILDAKRALEEENNKQLSVRIQESLSNDDLFDLSEDEVYEDKNLSMDMEDMKMDNE